MAEQIEKEFTKAEADLHNALTQRGWVIIEDYIHIHEHKQARVGFFAKRRLKKAITLFHKALDIAPDNYSSKWALGKIYQILDQHQDALKWFEDAWILESGNPDVCREASLAAMECGAFAKALDYSDKAIALNPDDEGLLCNKSLALMFLNCDTEAIETITAALQLNPDDQITLNVRSILHSIANGDRARPANMKEI